MIQPNDDISTPRQLRPQDAAAVDALIEARAAGPRLASSEDAQPQPLDPISLERIEALMSLLEVCPAGEPADDLVQRTMQRVTLAQTMDLEVQRVGAMRGPGVPMRMSEIIAVAAMVIVAVSLALPVLVQTRHEALRVACASNLAATGRALYHYGADYVGAMPRGNVQANSTWYGIGLTQNAFEPVKSNSANLYLVARSQYVDPGTLACPANEHAATEMSAEMYDWPKPQAVSYSYQNQFGPRAYRLMETPNMPIVADRNPRFVIKNGDGISMKYLKTMPLSAASLTHRSRGHNILLGDGSAHWAVHPVLQHHDNIWLAEGVSEYSGDEIPSRQNDAFLVP